MPADVSCICLFIRPGVRGRCSMSGESDSGECLVGTRSQGALLELKQVWWEIRQSCWDREVTGWGRRLPRLNDILNCLPCAFLSKSPPLHQLMSITFLNFLFKAQDWGALGSFPWLAQPDRSLICFPSLEPLWTQFVFFNLGLAVT